MPAQSEKSVLFVCMGNICRSPAAEGVFQHYVTEQGLQDDITIDSAGTIGYHVGEPADARMRKAAARRGYNLTSRARKVVESDLHEFDLIVVMDQDNYEDVQLHSRQPNAQILKLGAFLPGQGEPDVPDPYYGGDQGFERVLDMIESACPGILQLLQRDESA